MKTITLPYEEYLNMQEEFDIAHEHEIKQAIKAEREKKIDKLNLTKEEIDSIIEKFFLKMTGEHNLKITQVSGINFSNPYERYFEIEKL